MGLDEESDLLTPTGVVDASPLRMAMTDPVVPGDFDNGDEVDIVIAGGLAIGGNPPLVGHPAQAQVAVTGGEADPVSGLLSPAAAFATHVRRTTDAAFQLTVRAEVSLESGAIVVSGERTITRPAA